MTTVDACINLITDFYEGFYGKTDKLKERFINQYWVSSDIKKKSLIDRFQSDYDFLIYASDNIESEKDDNRLNIINEYRTFFKYATILLNNDVYNSDFINPFTGKQAIPHDIVEAKMYLFDASSPKEAIKKMNALWQQKKELHRKEKNNDNSTKDEVSNIYNDLKIQLEDAREGFAAIDDNLEYCIAFGDMTMKLGELAIASLEVYADVMEYENIDSE